MPASFGVALTHVLNGGTATVNHLNNPVYLASMKVDGFDGPIPVRCDRATGVAVDVWESFSDADLLSVGWVRADGDAIPPAPEGSFGWAWDLMRASPGDAFAPTDARPGLVWTYSDALGFRLRLPNGVSVRPAFPAREMRATWKRIVP